MKILLTGGSGLLGTEIQKYISCDAPYHFELDITHPIKKGDYDLIVHAAAYTGVERAEKNKFDCFTTNFLGTLNLAQTYKDVPFVHISTDYVANPINFYALSKLEGEKAVRSVAKNYLIIRTLFKPNPFPYEKAFIDQYTTGDYVDVITPLIVSSILLWKKNTCETIHIGTERKSIYELATRTRPNVQIGYVKDITTVRLPKEI